MILSILVDLASPMNCAKISPKACLTLEKKIFKGFNHTWARLGQRTATILAAFCSTTPKRLHMKFEHQWPSGFRGGRLKISTFFSYTCEGPIKWIGKQILSMKGVVLLVLTFIIASLNWPISSSALSKSDSATISSPF